MPKVFEQNGYRFSFYSNDHPPIHVYVRYGGIEIRFPVAANPRLAHGTAEQLGHVELSPYGIHWPDLDEDLSYRGLLRGDYGQRQNVEQAAPPNAGPAPPVGSSMARRGRQR